MFMSFCTDYSLYIRWFTRNGWRRTKDDIILEVTSMCANYNLLWESFCLNSCSFLHEYAMIFVWIPYSNFNIAPFSLFLFSFVIYFSIRVGLWIFMFGKGKETEPLSLSSFDPIVGHWMSVILVWHYAPLVILLDLRFILTFTYEECMHEFFTWNPNLLSAIISLSHMHFVAFSWKVPTPLPSWGKLDIQNRSSTKRL